MFFASSTILKANAVFLKEQLRKEIFCGIFAESSRFRITTPRDPPTNTSAPVQVPTNSQSSNLTLFTLSILTMSLSRKPSVCTVLDSNDIPRTTIFCGRKFATPLPTSSPISPPV